MVAIGQHKHRALDAAHEFLDDDAARSVAEHAAQHLLQFLLRFVKGGQNQYTLTGTQTVSLQHIRRCQRLQKCQSFLNMLAVEGLVACCRNVVAHHEGFGKVLRSLQYGTGLRRADDGNVLRPRVGFHVVVDTLH